MRTVLKCLVLVCVTVGACSEENPPTASVDTAVEFDAEAGGDAATFDFWVPDTNAEPLPGEFGAPCTGNEECYSGFCIETPNGNRCTITCVSDCPIDFECRQKDGGDPVYVCMSAKLPEKCNGIDDDKDGITDEGPWCNDGNLCTVDKCNDDGSCTHTELNGEMCDDGSVCTEVDKCYGPTCKGAKQLACTDGNVCTDDNVCDPVSGCLFPFNSASCDDGNPCTVQDTCSGGECTVSKPRACDDGNACTMDACDPNKGPTGCVFKNLMDGVAATGGSGGCPVTLPYCKSGKCAPAP